MGLTERHWFEDEEPELTERQLEDNISIQDRVYRRGYHKGYSDGVKEQEEKMEHLNNITLEYEKEVFRLQNLLKEQEAVEPYQHDAVWLCGNCEKEVVGWDDDIDGKENRYPFCRQCGKAVKWKWNL